MTLEQIIPVEAQEQLITSGFNMMRTVPQAENCHDLISLEKEMSTLYASFAESVAVRRDEGRIDIMLANDSVDLVPDRSGKIRLEVKRIPLKGMQRSYIIKRLIEVNGIIDTYTSGDWELYMFHHNGHILQAGFMDSEYGIVSYLRVYRPRTDYNEPSVEEYYNTWKDKTKKNKRGMSVTPHDDAYGDAASGLGSIFTDQVRDQLDEIYAYVKAIKDDPEYSMEIEALRELLDVTPE